jgi:hypothetical protein
MALAASNAPALHPYIASELMMLEESGRSHSQVRLYHPSGSESPGVRQIV